MKSRSFNTVEISRSALENNYRALERRTKGETAIMAMVKADAYGHGMLEAVEVFRASGCTVFGVAEMREAEILRQAGVSEDIFVTIGFACTDAELFFQHRLIPVIYDIGSAQSLADRAVAHGTTIGVHIKVDTGMGRLGILPEESIAFMEAVEKMAGLQIAGIMSHFPESDNPVSPSTLNGLRIFRGVCTELKKRYRTVCHIANSGAVLNFPDTHCDMVRAGIALYGYHPAGAESGGEEVGLVPAMSFSSRVLQVKNLPAGSGISYGHTFKTKTDTKIAVIPVGYEDGYRRSLSNKGCVLVRGEYAPVVGRVCMNMCMVDVSRIEAVQPGDEVVLLGSQNEKRITADDLAVKGDTISYEILCNLGNSNNRQYIA